MIENPSDLYDELVKVTIPEERAHWTSDLLVRATPEVKSVIRRYKYAHQVFRFKDRIDGNIWYEIPFAFKPYWEGKKDAEV